MCMCGGVCICMLEAAHRGRKRILDTPGTSVTGGCEHPDVDAQKQIQVFCKNSSQPLSYLSCPLVGFPTITTPFNSNDVYFKFKMLTLIIEITLILFSILSCECKNFRVFSNSALSNIPSHTCFSVEILNFATLAFSFLIENKKLSLKS